MTMQELRNGFDCRKIVCDEVTGLNGLQLETQPRILKIGVPLAGAAGARTSTSGSIVTEGAAAGVAGSEEGASAVASEMRQWEQALTGGRASAPAATLAMQASWMYADAGYELTKKAAAANPLRWSKGSVADIVTELQV